MKFCAFVIAALSGVVFADFNLRSVARSFMSPKTSDPVDVRVIVKGIPEDLDKNDMKIMAKSIVTAYNEAYEDAGHTLQNFQPHTSVDVGSFDAFWWRPGDAHCRLCPNDDDAKDTDFATQLILAHVKVALGWWRPGDAHCRLCPNDDDMLNVEFGLVHKKFEKKFCSMLRSSPSNNLKHAHDCSFSFLATTAKAGYDVACDNEQPVEVQVTMDGTLHDFSQDDITLINRSAMEAYDEAFLSADYALGNFEVVASVKKGKPERPGSRLECHILECDDDNMASLGETKLIAAKIAPLCPIEGAAPPDKAKLLEFLHEAFEKALCAKLANSGSAQFANVKNCSFRVVTDPFTFAQKA